MNFHAYWYIVKFYSVYYKIVELSSHNKSIELIFTIRVVESLRIPTTTSAWTEPTENSH